MTNHIRTQDPVIRAQQWARMSLCTTAIAIELELARKLRAFLASAKAYQVVEWHYPRPETELLKALAKAIKQGQERLTTTTEKILSLNSELEALKTALVDDYGDDTI